MPRAAARQGTAPWPSPALRRADRRAAQRNLRQISRSLVGMSPASSGSTPRLANYPAAHKAAAIRTSSRCPVRAAQCSGRIRPQLGQAAQQRGLAGCRTAQRSPARRRLSSARRGVDQLVAVRRAYLDAFEFDDPRRWTWPAARAAPGPFVGLDQSVEPDDRCAVAGEFVVCLRKNDSESWILPNAVAVCVTSPNPI